MILKESVILNKSDCSFDNLVIEDIEVQDTCITQVPHVPLTIWDVVRHRPTSNEAHQALSKFQMLTHILFCVAWSFSCDTGCLNEKTTLDKCWIKIWLELRSADNSKIWYRRSRVFSFTSTYTCRQVIFVINATAGVYSTAGVNRKRQDYNICDPVWENQS